MQPFFISRFFKNCLFSLIGGQLLHNTVVVSPDINMNQPRAHLCCAPWALPPPTHPTPLGRPEHRLWVLRFTQQACTGHPFYFMVKDYLFMVMMRTIRDCTARSWDGLAVLSVFQLNQQAMKRHNDDALIQKAKGWCCHRVDACGLSSVNYWQNPGFSQPSRNAVKQRF